MDKRYLAYIEDDDGVARWFQGWQLPNKTMPSFRPIDTLMIEYEEPGMIGEILSEREKDELDQYLNKVKFIRIA